MKTLAEQVRDGLQKLPPFKKMLVGLSGGIDSVVLTHVLKALGYEVICAHVDHQLRGAASRHDEAFCSALVGNWGLEYKSVQVDVPKRGNTEALAREARYRELEKAREACGAEVLAVGHHLDDQIETILMHDKRGAGLRGQRGMQMMSGQLIRPLLEIPRRDIEAYAREHGLVYILDESNLDLSFERNHLRSEIIPELRKDPRFETEIKERASQAAKKLEALEQGAKRWLTGEFVDGSFSREAFSELSGDAQVEVLLQLLGPTDIYSKNLTKLLQFIQEGANGKTLSLKSLNFVLEYDRVRVLQPGEPGAAIAPTTLAEETRYGDYRIRVNGPAKLRARPWRAGDRFQPSGMRGHKKLQDFFVDAKIPRLERRAIPIIVDEKDAIICVGDLRFSEEFKHLKDRIRVEKT